MSCAYMCLYTSVLCLYVLVYISLVPICASIHQSCAYMCLYTSVLCLYVLVYISLVPMCACIHQSHAYMCLYACVTCLYAPTCIYIFTCAYMCYMCVHYACMCLYACDIPLCACVCSVPLCACMLHMPCPHLCLFVHSFIHEAACNVCIILCLGCVVGLRELCIWGQPMHLDSWCWPLYEGYTTLTPYFVTESSLYCVCPCGCVCTNMPWLFFSGVRTVVTERLWWPSSVRTYITVFASLDTMSYLWIMGGVCGHAQTKCHIIYFQIQEISSIPVISGVIGYLYTVRLSWTSGFTGIWWWRERCTCK